MTLQSLVPMAFVDSVSRSIAFYAKLGFEVGNTHTADGGEEPVWVWLKCGRAQLMLSKSTEPVDPGAQAVLFYLYASDLAAYRQRLVDAGVDAGPIKKPFWAPNGEFRVTDPDGYVLLVMHT
jgi:hypothetical protein